MIYEQPRSSHLVWQPAAVSVAQHQERSGHRGAVIWLTGLPGSGKSTVARAAQHQIHLAGYATVLLDGDNLRHGLCADLGFSVADRNENVRRTGEVAKLFLETGVIVFVALVSPIRAAREAVRQRLPAGDFLEVYCRCPIEVCRQRDPKGHYAKAENGSLRQFTGVSSPYEEPLEPNLILDTDTQSVQDSVNCLTRKLCTDLMKEFVL
jgi:adenylylsulfate kinase